MSHKLRCIMCSGEHKARRDKFPRSYAQEQTVEVGRGKKAVTKKVMVSVHICAKCDRKHAKLKFMKDNGINPVIYRRGMDIPTVIIRVKDAIRDRIMAISLKNDMLVKP